VEEQQIDVVIVAVEGDSLLPLDKREAGTKLQKETLNLAQQRRLEILLAEGVAQSQEIKQVRILEHEVGRKLVALPEGRKLFSNDLLGLLRERGALEEHAVDLLLKRAGAPALGTTHLCVELALQGILHRDQQFEMRPTQLSPQCRDNLGIGKCLRELEHPAQVLLLEAAPEPFHQLSPQCGDNLGAVLSPALFQDVLVYSRADLPVSRNNSVRSVQRLRFCQCSREPQLTGIRVVSGAAGSRARRSPY